MDKATGQGTSRNMTAQASDKAIEKGAKVQLQTMDAIVYGEVRRVCEKRGTAFVRIERIEGTSRWLGHQVGKLASFSIRGTRMERIQGASQ